MSCSKSVSYISLMVLLLWTTIPACGPTNSGKLDGPCYGNGTCDNGLSCVSNVCQSTGVGKLGGPCYGNGTCNDGVSCIANVCQTTEPASSEQSTSDDAGGVDNIAPDIVTTSDTAPEKVAEKIPETNTKFSFFVTSLEAMQKLSGSQDGFGGDLGGLVGADKICQTVAAGVGAGNKTWRAFLSVTKGPDGKPVNAIDRIGSGPWYDRNGRLISQNIQGLLSSDRPQGDKQAVLDMTNEHGQSQNPFGDNHDIMTGTNKQGKLNSTDPISTCNDWTSKVGPGSEKKVMAGHSWPRGIGNGQTTGRGASWLADHTIPGCAPGINLKQGPSTGNCVGCSGGYGGIYCFALTP